MYSGYSWLLPPVLLGSWLAIRPFLESWLSVVYFFALEAVFIVVLALATIWLTRPFLRLAIAAIELGLKRILPLETLLTVRRVRLTSQRFVFSITGVILVFSMLSGLHAITRTLKQEIFEWSSDAITPYMYYQRNPSQEPDSAAIMIGLANSSAVTVESGRKPSVETSRSVPMACAALRETCPRQLTSRSCHKPLLKPTTSRTERTAKKPRTKMNSLTG